MADDEDMGTSFMRQHMSEAAISKEPGGFGNAPKRKLRDFTDDAIERHYGKEIDMSPGADQTVNRSRKGNKG